MSANGYSYGGHHAPGHPPPTPSYSSMPPIQPGGPLLSTGPLAGPAPANGAGPAIGLGSQQQQHAQLAHPHAHPHPHQHHQLPGPSYAPYPPQPQPPQPQPQPQHAPHLAHHAQHHQYIARPISAASMQSPGQGSAVISTHSQNSSPQFPPPPQVSTPRATLPDSSTATESPPPIPKARSSVACALCRKQKMKCEGPDKKPCRRCRAAGVECVFEAPPVSVPRPRANGATEAWVEARFNQVEQRVSNLEDSASLAQPSQDDGANASAISDHERRIAALEAQIYALQLQAAQPPPVQRQTQLDYQPSPIQSLSSSGSGHPPSHSYSNAQYGMPSPASGHSLPPFLGGNAAGANRYDGSASLKHEGDVTGAYAVDGFSGIPSAKRWKGDARDAESSIDGPDFISRGVVTEEEAAMCFDSYFLTFAANSPHSDQRPLSFAETRVRSPAYLATIISIGARSLSRFETFHASLAEALRLVYQMFSPDNDGLKLHTMLTVKAVTLLGLYHSMPHLLLASGMLGYKLGLRTALDDYEMLPDEEKRSKVGKKLIAKGRILIVSYLWTAFYTYQAGEPTCFDISMDVLHRQVDILSNSPYTEQPTDHVIRTNLEECAILLGAFQKLGAGMSLDRRGVDDVRATVDQGIRDLERWNEAWRDMMVTVSQWGDSREIKEILPFHHGRQCLMRYIFRPEIPLHEYDRNDPKLREYAILAMESALVILRWGVESRIWMPFSIVGGYVHTVNIPTALHHLFTASRLFPRDADFLTIRPLLHRLLKQCDVTIRGPASTKREIYRAELTKTEVLEFDRFAFEASGEEVLRPEASDDHPPGLVGHEIGQSLAAFRLELNLWSAPLRSDEDDT